MKISMSERRLIENEIYFRRPNEKVAKGLVELKKMAEQDGQTWLYPESDDPVGFFCECSDENCRLKIKIKPSKYLELHQNSAQFTLKPGHAIPKIEKTILNTKDYIVVEKFMIPSHIDSKTLKSTLTSG